jgi:glucokinase
MKHSGQRIAIGVDLGGTAIKFALGSEDGKIIKEDTTPTKTNASSESILASLRDVIIQMKEYARQHDYQPVAVGLGSPGSIEIKTGFLMGSTPNFSHWGNVEIKKELEKGVGLPVFADNDANLMALGETRFGAGVGHQNIICLTIGTGVGGGIIINNNLYRGFHCAGAELGHISLELEGVPCNCGGKGCLEVYASASAILRNFKNQCAQNSISVDEEKTDVRYIFQLYRKNDPLAVKVITEACYYLGRGLATLINIFNPSMFIIGGGVADAGEIYLSKVRETAYRYAMEKSREHVQIVGAKLGNKAGYLGAISFALESFDQAQESQAV